MAGRFQAHDRTIALIDPAERERFWREVHLELVLSSADFPNEASCREGKNRTLVASLLPHNLRLSNTARSQSKPERFDRIGCLLPAHVLDDTNQLTLPFLLRLSAHSSVLFAYLVRRIVRVTPDGRKPRARIIR